MADIKASIGTRNTGVVFPAVFSKQSKHISYSTIFSHYQAAYKKLGIVAKSSSHTLRATSITGMFEREIPIPLILNVTGHSSTDLALYYNLTENKSKEVTKSCMDSFDCLYNL
jgi:hypothetical protein